MAKPERAIFDHLQSTLAIDPSQAVFLDDHRGNIDAARRCGWQAVQFESAAQAEGELRTLGLL